MLDYPRIDVFQVYSASAVGNVVQILLMPSAWMYEALEGWTLGPNPEVFSDYELTKGRRDYPANIAGAYHATRLPILEHLNQSRRQAGALAFLEVTRDWVPLGVWRFRELARKAFQNPVSEYKSLDLAQDHVYTGSRIPGHIWRNSSRILPYYKKQSSLDVYT